MWFTMDDDGEFETFNTEAEAKAWCEQRILEIAEHCGGWLPDEDMTQISYGYLTHKAVQVNKVPREQWEKDNPKEEWPDENWSHICDYEMKIV